ncbi:MAG: transketolase [Bacteroidota bacterium]
MSYNSIDELCINTIRFLAVDTVQKANSGHPGMPMACAPIVYSLYTRFMQHNPANPGWFNRDRFILSAGHGSSLLYSILHLTGYDISLDDMKNFRQFNSKTPGHPEYEKTPGVETTTGPLGQGFANAVGLAMAEQHWSAVFNTDDISLLDHYIYAIASDGDLMEGISHEAASLAGHLKLGKLIVFYDDNKISIDGSTDLSFSEDVEKRFAAYGWHTQKISDVNQLDDIASAVENARKETTRPSIIITRTHIGYGSPNKQDKSSCHGSPLGADEVALTKSNLGWDSDKFFYIPEEAAAHYRESLVKGKLAEEKWNKLLEEYCSKYPAKGELFRKFISGEGFDGWEKLLPVFPAEKKMATRVASGKVLNAVAAELPVLIGGSADLTPSNNTYLNGLGDFSTASYSGRNIHYGIREHAMASVMNGMALYGSTIPYAGTFLVFSDYMKPAIRIAALSSLHVIYVFTHDSIGLGEDGPTHQPIEHLAALRAIPGLLVIRPADANETAAAWKTAISLKGTPVALVFSRQDLPVLDHAKYNTDGLQKGAYILSDCDGKPDIIIMASGSELHPAAQAAERLSAEGVKVRVVSFPCWELFEMQSSAYKESILPSDVKLRISAEAGISMGWDKYTGSTGRSVSIESFGASAPAEILMEHFGFTAGNIFNAAKEMLNR